VRRATSLVAAGVLACVCPALPARADAPPNAWDIAKDSAVRDRWELHEAVRREMAFGQERDYGTLRDAALQHARAELEDADAAHSPDVRLRFDLGEIYELLDMHDRAVAVLAPALGEAGDEPAATHAWVMLAYAYAHLDRTKDERAAYAKYLDHETDDRYRVTALLNLAEADMRLGFLEEAVAGYRETIALAVSLPLRQGKDDEVLGTWGLAVALDRSGDPTGAAAAALQATNIDSASGRSAGWHPDFRRALICNTDFVFFVPPYERYWYIALGKTEDAKQAPDARAAAREWAIVEEFWGRYVSDATRAASPDRWLPRARAHLERAHAERLAAEKRAKGMRPERALPNEGELFIH